MWPNLCIFLDTRDVRVPLGCKGLIVAEEGVSPVQLREGLATPRYGALMRPVTCVRLFVYPQGVPCQEPPLAHLTRVP